MLLFIFKTAAAADSASLFTIITAFGSHSDPYAIIGHAQARLAISEISSTDGCLQNCGNRNLFFLVVWKFFVSLPPSTKNSSPGCFSPLSILTFTPANLIEFCEEVMRNVLLIIILSPKNKLYSLWWGVYGYQRQEHASTRPWAANVSVTTFHTTHISPTAALIQSRLEKWRQIQYYIKSSKIWDHKHIKCKYVIFYYTIL